MVSNTSQLVATSSACDTECWSASLILGSISLMIVASALGCLFAAWKCRDQREIAGGTQNSRQTFDIVATSRCGSAERKVTAEGTAGIDAV